MKIIFVLENFPPYIGGAEVVHKNITERLARLGHDITVVTHWIKGTKKKEIVNGVKIYRVKVPLLGARYWFSFCSIPSVWRLAKDADLIQTTTYNGAVSARFVAKFLKKPSVILVHEVLGKNWENLMGMSKLTAKVHEFLERLIMSLGFDAFVSVSESTQKNVLDTGMPASRSRVIYNGIDYGLLSASKYSKNRIREKYGIKDDEFLYISYGRPGITKGIEFLIKAVPLISKKIKKSRLMLVLSDDPHDRYLKMLELIRKLRLEKKIILVSRLEKKDLLNHIKAADTAVIPSLTEGFGYSVVEACCMGIPVVASNTTSIPEVVWGKHVLVKPGDPEAIAAGVEMAYKKRFNVLPKKDFSWDRNIKGFLKLYKELI